MNIFFLDSDPILSAQYQCDKHVVKMVVESTQLLSTAMWMNNQYGPYRKTHINHPCSIWVRASHENFCWLIRHAFALSAEYSYRYGKPHACHEKLQEISSLYNHGLPHIGFTFPALAMPEKYKSDNFVKSYRDYYFFEKFNIAKWNKNRSQPDWFLDYIKAKDLLYASTSSV